jgi:hypothetical protein
VTVGAAVVWAIPPFPFGTPGFYSFPRGASFFAFVHVARLYSGGDTRSIADASRPVDTTSG